MESLNSKISKLEAQVILLQDQITDLTKSTAQQTKPPYTKTKSDNPSQKHPTDIKTGLGAIRGSFIHWNDAELKKPPYGQQPGTPTVGYALHGHNRYAGGALDIHTLELVEYENIDGAIINIDGDLLNHSCQQFWKKDVNIALSEGVQKIGKLDIEFDPSSGKWIAGSGAINVKTTRIVEYAWYKDGVEVDADTEGATREIKRDDNGNNMDSVINGEDDEGVAEEDEGLRENMVWDKNAQCWRFYAVYAD